MKLIKTLLAATLALACTLAFAAVDANKATQAELQSIKGVGPAMSGRILEARKTGAFKDWSDLVGRVKGVGSGNAGKFSREGLTVNGAAYAATTVVDSRGAAKSLPRPATPAAALDTKPMPAPAAKEPAKR